jgi:hypothetical protein
MNKFFRIFFVFNLVASSLLFANDGPSGSVGDQPEQAADQQSNGQSSSAASSASSTEKDSFWDHAWSWGGTAASILATGAQLVPAKVYIAGAVVLATGYSIRTLANRGEAIKREARRRKDEKSELHARELNREKENSFSVGRIVGGLEVLIKNNGEKLSAAESKLREFEQKWISEHTILRSSILNNKEKITGLQERTKRLESKVAELETNHTKLSDRVSGLEKNNQLLNQQSQ